MFVHEVIKPRRIPKVMGVRRARDRRDERVRDTERIADGVEIGEHGRRCSDKKEAARDL
jgi:hypothetical protein